MKKPSTPGSLHLTHATLLHGNFTGDEVLNIVNQLEVIDDYVYVNGENTGINVRGQDGAPGKSAYDSYVEVCESQGVTPLSEQDWVDTLQTVTYIGSEGVQSDYAETDVEKLSFILNKPLTVEKNADVYDILFDVDE